MIIDIKLVVLDLRIGTDSFPYPKSQTKGSAGIDLMAMPRESLLLRPGRRGSVSSGISLHINDPGFVGIIVPRSGLGSKGIVLSNLVGVIDSDYTGEIKLSLWNTSEEDFIVEPGMRVAQLLIVPVVTAAFSLVVSHEETTRGEGGFGSTGLL